MSWNPEPIWTALQAEHDARVCAELEPEKPSTRWQRGEWLLVLAIALVLAATVGLAFIAPGGAR